mgnify:CR=1 FL=1
MELATRHASRPTCRTDLNCESEHTTMCNISHLQDFNIALVGYALCIGKTSCDSLGLGLTELNGEALASAHSSQASMKRRMTQPPSEDAVELHMLRRGAHARAAL